MEINDLKKIKRIIQKENEILLQKIEKKLSNDNKVKEDKPFLDFKETCKFLSCSESYLYKMTSTNQIPHSKRGKKLFFDKNELLEWVMKNKIRTQDEIASQVDDFLASKSKFNTSKR